MKELSNQVLGGELSASDFNEIPKEIENVITESGQSLSGVDFTQLLQAIRILTATPVGSIIGWHKSFGGTPALSSGWVECNGQVLVDPESVYNGFTIPNINGDGRFLRGGALSGTMQAEEFKAHTHTEVADGPTGAGNSGAGGTPLTHNVTAPQTGSAGGAETRPINMSVVWIMRVK
jgi:hypothetical protein